MLGIVNHAGGIYLRVANLDRRRALGHGEDRDAWLDSQTNTVIRLPIGQVPGRPEAPVDWEARARNAEAKLRAISILLDKTGL